MPNSKLKLSELRQKYLDFLKSKDHVVVPSAPLVPENDPTTLFTSAGMQSMIPYLLGAEHPLGKRIANSQKCLRAEDIEEVGDNRHTTFFEMLGNWSLGDYFRKEQLQWVFEFLTQQAGLDPLKLYVTVFEGSEEYDIPRDNESIKLWQELFGQAGIEAKVVENPAQEGVSGRIYLYKWKNWWSRAGEPENMPVGEPGGPDSEIFYDFGEELGLHERSEFADQKCHLNCDCGRFLEIGNSVFMQFKKTDDGFETLSQKNIDFGGGLERILAASANLNDIFLTSAFEPIISSLESLTGLSYQSEVKPLFRIIADHIKAAVMLMTDGVMPGSKEQGYVVRRLIRRSIRQAFILGFEDDFLSALVEPIVEIYQDQYPALAAQAKVIRQALLKEEKRFKKTIRRGLSEFRDQIETKKQLDGELAFRLYQSYGFPLEMSIEEAEVTGVKISAQLHLEFEQEKEKHAAKSRSGSEQKFKGGLADQTQATTAYHTTTHLLHAALRQVLGEHVQQQGSNITASRLRFDFSYSRALTSEEIEQIQEQVNQWIEQSLPVSKEALAKKEALNSGALAFFRTKYPDEVTVYTVGAKDDWVSRELCGGPHVENTSEIKPIEIFKEKSASAGVRRVYARFKQE